MSDAYRTEPIERRIARHELAATLRPILEDWEATNRRHRRAMRAIRAFEIVCLALGVAAIAYAALEPWL